jgi:hypothetical protein
MDHSSLLDLLGEESFFLLTYQTRSKVIPFTASEVVNKSMAGTLPGFQGLSPVKEPGASSIFIQMIPSKLSANLSMFIGDHGFISSINTISRQIHPRPSRGNESDLR